MQHHCPEAPLVVATGCVANLFADELAALAPNVTVERDKSRVPAAVLEGLGAGALAVGDDGELLSGASVVSASTPTPTGRTRPGIKIQDGCDNRCTYCIVWKARGASRSVDAARVRELVLRSLERGASEVVLTGINLGVYRSQLPDGREVALPGLLAWLLETTPVGRIRLSSIEPPDVTDDLLSTMTASNGRIAPFLHICLQSGCDATLKRMARAYDTAYFRSAVVRAHEFLPQASRGRTSSWGSRARRTRSLSSRSRSAEKWASRACTSLGYSSARVRRPPPKRARWTPCDG